MFACPICHGALNLEKDAFRCVKCRRLFPVVDGIPVLVDEKKLCSMKKGQRDIYEQEAKLESMKQLINPDYYKYVGSLRELKDLKLFRQGCFVSGTRVLDIGCSSGRVLNVLHSAFDGIVGIGIDISLEAIKVGRKRNPYDNTLYVSDAENLPFDDDFFDIVICFDVFEHIPNPDKCVSEISRVLKRGGLALVYAVSKNEKYTWHWVQRLVTFDRLGVDIVGGHNRENFLFVSDVCEKMTKSELQIQKVIYFHAFFTLIFDETIPALRRLLGEFYRFCKRSTTARSKIMATNCQLDETQIAQRATFFAIFLTKAIQLACYLALPVFELFDKPWTSHGYSNGFYVLATKM